MHSVNSSDDKQRVGSAIATNTGGINTDKAKQQIAELLQ